MKLIIESDDGLKVESIHIPDNDIPTIGAGDISAIFAQMIVEYAENVGVLRAIHNRRVRRQKQVTEQFHGRDEEEDVPF